MEDDNKKGGSGAMTVMFVCMGNTCRSVMAQYYATKAAADRELDLKFTSSGLSAESAMPAPPIVKELLIKEGAPEFDHTPLRITAKNVKEAGLILVMTHAHKAAILDKFPAAFDKTYTLQEYAGFGHSDVDDPYGRDEKFYFETFRLIKKSVDGMLEKLNKKHCL